MPEILIRVVLPIIGIVACLLGTMLMVAPACRPSRAKPVPHEQAKTITGASIILAGFILIAVSGIQ